MDRRAGEYATLALNGPNFFHALNWPLLTKTAFCMEYYLFLSLCSAEHMLTNCWGTTAHCYMLLYPNIGEIASIRSGTKKQPPISFDSLSLIILFFLFLYQLSPTTQYSLRTMGYIHLTYTTIKTIAASCISRLILSPNPISRIPQ